jgi:membrane protein DedA with SNARE-associated domain
LLGRRFRNQRRVETIKQRPAFTKAQRILERHPKSFIFFFRFLYGLRTVSPIAIGLSNIPSRMFVPLNILAAVIWGSLFTLIGYYLGMAVEPLLHDFKSILIICIALVLIGMLALFTLRHIRAKKMQV